MKAVCLTLCTIAVSVVSAFQVGNVRLRRSRSTKWWAYVDVSEGAERDMGAFDEWAGVCGVQRADGVQLTVTNEYPLEVGVMTAQDLPGETPILVVPQNMILSSFGAMQEFGRVEAAEQRLISAKGAQHVPKFYLFLKILVEYEKGDESPWYPWLNSLPRFYANGSAMTPFCFECLPPLAGYLAMNERIKFIQFYQALKYVDSHFISDYTKDNKDLAKWAFSVVYTRHFQTSDGDFKIVPMADMINHHGTNAEAELQISYDDDGNCGVYTNYDIPAGSPLRISYGDPTNPSNLFAKYGFLDESSPATFCKIMIPKPTRELVNMGYDHSKMLFYKETGDVSQEVWDVLLYQILESDPAVQQQLYNAHMTGDYETKQAIHQQYYPQIFIALQNHVDSFLLELDNLQSKGFGKDVNDHPRLPLIMQHNEFVKETFMKVSSKLQQYA